MLENGANLFHYILTDPQEVDKSTVILLSEGLGKRHHSV
jgi:hypothetical protein